MNKKILWLIVGVIVFMAVKKKNPYE